ncbi:HD domain-containing protein [[Clostridium] polysaccharolyticum]|jgi:uncharacterized protein|uniref:HD domain-containing protein n=1 Tax=[Clostridium] polysaccharolyticum TaxID=29364 RepID=A0A1I0EY97_9FIRM|nr:HD domain-containing protein [[Clostridium] polysaccharolyticum]SET50626.1 HD domain-containing protein [[Clostridium] polysaccharolyticum]
MERLEKLLDLPDYKVVLEQIEDFEKERIYCRHGKEHFRDVARIAYILSLENKLELSKEMIYVTAFLHDMGRAYEYKGFCSHESGSVLMALDWLPKCGFTEEQIKEIITAIKEHRKNGADGTLGKVLYQADKLSRDCFSCKAQAACKWPDEKKNRHILY